MSKDAHKKGRITQSTFPRMWAHERTGYSEKRSMTKRLKTSVLDKPCSGWQTTRQPCSSQTLASTVNVLSSVVTLKYVLIVKVYCSVNEESFEVQDIYNSSCCITNLKQRICSTRNACPEYANRTSLAHCTCFACREHFNHTPHEYSINQMMSPNTLNTHEKTTALSDQHKCTQACILWKTDGTLLKMETRPVNYRFTCTQ